MSDKPSYIISTFRKKRALRRLIGSVFITALLLTFLSPFAVRLISQHIQRVQLENTRLTKELTLYMLSTPLPKLQVFPYGNNKEFNYWNALFEDALQESHVNKFEKINSLQTFEMLYQHADRILGESQTHVWVRLLILETRNQARGKISLFHSPQAALMASQRWFSLIHAALNAPVDPRNPIFVNVIVSATPSLSAPEVVAANSRDIFRAAHLVHLSPGLLAAIVDNEQAGAKLAYGLSGGVRQLAANVAQDEAIRGNSRLWRYFSHNLGLTQMSWEDTEKQGPRLKALGLKWIPIPQNEFEARKMLRSPRLNVLFAASRIRGYLNAYYNRPVNDIRPYTDAWLYIIGPGWHNRPKLMADDAVWNYTWNGFFKAALYERLLPAWAMQPGQLISN